MKKVIFPLTVLLTLSAFTQSCKGQIENSHSERVRVVGGGCEGCEGLYEYGSKLLNNVDTLPLFEVTEPKLKITGTVFKKDGKTPAPDVILYIYHTSREGIYETKGDETGWARRHGFIRGWIKTDQSGRYIFYTFRPGAYPDGSEPEHIHLTVKEPKTNAYYLDDFLFDDDPLLTEKERKKWMLRNRGGSGVVILQSTDSMLTVERDIILGLNIPDYE